MELEVKADSKIVAKQIHDSSRNIQKETVIDWLKKNDTGSDSSEMKQFEDMLAELNISNKESFYKVPYTLVKVDPLPSPKMQPCQNKSNTGRSISGWVLKR